MRDELPSGTVTFLFTDVEGSTQLMRALGTDAYTEALAEHRRAIRAACAEHGGVEVDTQGDAFFFAFSTAPGAAAAASALTEALSSGPIQARVGVHTGTPLVTDEGYTGIDVVLGARIASSAHGGQVVLSSATRELLDEGPALTRLGEHRFKDVEEPVSIFQLGSVIFAPLRTISNTNLPRPMSSFIGREGELAEVLAKLEEGTRLLTLTGPGGSGKTRLAIEAAASIVPDYEAGVSWVGLASLRDPALVVETIAQALGAKDGLVEHIGNREMLILVDNLEQVIDSAPELSSLLSACPNLTLLVTSRELLRVQGEVEYPVPPLAEPEAVNLFCERARLEPSEEIAELCARLDNLPLAVELAAARAKALTPAQILERLSGRLDLLKGGRDADPRQQTLRATIEWSYELLSAQEQWLFARLSVFAGGCTLDAAEEVCDADVDTMQSLVEKSLLRFSAQRYWMLETIRELARERLEESSESELVGEAHAEHYTRGAEAANRERMYGTDLRSATSWFRTEQENLREAVTWSSSRPKLRLRLLHAIRMPWTAAGFADEFRIWIESALTLAGDLDPIMRARAFASASTVASAQGDWAAQLEYSDQSLELYSSLGDEEGIALSLVGRGGALQNLGRIEEARAVFAEALRMARLASSRPVMLGAGQAFAFLAIEEHDFDLALSLAAELDDFEKKEWPITGLIIGLVALEKGDASEARRLLAKAAAQSHELSFDYALAFDLDALAAALADSDDVERAVVLAGKAAAIRDALGSEPESYERTLRERVAVAGRRDLGEEVYRAATERGASMSVDDAFELALGDA